MHAAYKKVPPENRTHKAVAAADDNAGMAPINMYVSNATTGEADANASKALCDLYHGHFAAMNVVANPKATGAL